MVAGLRRRAAAQRRCTARPRDAGFTLVETIVSIALIGIVMTALTTFFATVVGAVNLQGATQVAIHLADDGTEQVRALKGSAVATGRDENSVDAQWASPVVGVAPYLADMAEAWDSGAAFPDGATAPLPTTSTPVTINGVLFGQNWYVGDCWQPLAGGDCDAVKVAGEVPFFRVVVAVTWSDKHCPAAACSRITSTLVSSESAEPVFNPSAGAQPATVDNPGSQVGEVSVAVRLQFTANGGAPPLTWSASGLPAGLSMNSSGLVSGTPTTAGTVAVTAAVVDGFGLVGSAGLSWTVNARPALTTPAAQATAVGGTVSLTLAATGGTTPYVWSATGLPAGLVLGSTGVITGTPTAAGVFSLVVTVTDAAKVTASTGSITWTVSPAPTVTVPGTTGTGTVGGAVHIQAVATSGVGPYTWAATGLPAGLKIDSTGLISGTLTGGTRYLSAVTVTDAVGGTGRVTVVWAVTAASGGLQVTAPVADRTGNTVGQTAAVAASASGGSGTGYTWTASGLPPGAVISTAGAITGKFTLAGTYTVTLTVTDSAKKVAVVMFTWTIT